MYQLTQLLDKLNPIALVLASSPSFRPSCPYCRWPLLLTDLVTFRRLPSYRSFRYPIESWRMPDPAHHVGRRDPYRTQIWWSSALVRMAVLGTHLHQLVDSAVLRGPESALESL
jgi:hypothetical protein